MTSDERVCAIVVTFHPRPEHLQNLAQMRAQVDHLIVVDNGSGEQELALIRLRSSKLGFELLVNSKNLGIAAALNLGVRKAQQRGCRWVALFDQDSAITEGFIATMVAEFQAYRPKQKILQIIPRYRDPETGVERPVSRFRGWRSLSDNHFGQPLCYGSIRGVRTVSRESVHLLRR